MSILRTNQIQDTSGNSAMMINSNGVINQPNKPMFQVGLSAAQSIPNATVSLVNFNDIQTSSGGFNIGGYFDTGNYWFKPLVAGYYYFDAQLVIENATPDYLGVYIYKNGTEIRYNVGTESNAANAYVGAHTSTFTYMNGSTDYVNVYALHNSGSSKNLQITFGRTQFGGYMI